MSELNWRGEGDVRGVLDCYRQQRDSIVGIQVDVRYDKRNSKVNGLSRAGDSGTEHFSSNSKFCRVLHAFLDSKCEEGLHHLQQARTSVVWAFHIVPRVHHLRRAEVYLASTFSGDALS